jgi:hypothetical protein
MIDPLSIIHQDIVAEEDATICPDHNSAYCGLSTLSSVTSKRVMVALRAVGVYRAIYHPSFLLDDHLQVLRGFLIFFLTAKYSGKLSLLGLKHERS